MKNLFIILILLLTSGLVHGKINKTVSVNTSISSKTNIKKIKVFGMACPLCQSKAEKKFKEVSAVDSVDVDMEKMLITLKLKDGMDLSPEKIKPTVESLGLTFVKVVK